MLLRCAALRGRVSGDQSRRWLASEAGEAWDVVYDARKERGGRLRWGSVAVAICGGPVATGLLFEAGTYSTWMSCLPAAVSGLIFFVSFANRKTTPVEMALSPDKSTLAVTTVGFLGADVVEHVPVAAVLSTSEFGMNGPLNIKELIVDQHYALRQHADAKQIPVQLPARPSFYCLNDANILQPDLVDRLMLGRGLASAADDSPHNLPSQSPPIQEEPPRN